MSQASRPYATVSALLLLLLLLLLSYYPHDPLFFLLLFFFIIIAFHANSAFNQDISSWNVSRVTDMFRSKWVWFFDPSFSRLQVISHSHTTPLLYCYCCCAAAVVPANLAPYCSISTRYSLLQATLRASLGGQHRDAE